MKVSDAIAFGAEQIEHDEQAQQIARRLLANVLAIDAAVLLAHGERRLASDEIDAYFRLVTRAARQEPLAYIFGRVPFRRLELEASPAALIPRPETEQLVERALAWIGGRQGLAIADVGTGSGCIAVSLAYEAPGNRVLATDVAADALALARRNAARFSVTVDLRHGSLLEPIDEPLDLIVANLPYVAADEWQQVDESVKRFEPRLALDGGVDGLDLIEALLRQAKTRLKPDGAVFLEIGWRQRQPCLALATRHFATFEVACYRDYGGNDRIVAITART